MPEKPSSRARAASCSRTALRSCGNAGVGMGVFRHKYNGPMSQARGLYSVAQVRAFDERAIHELGVPGYTLMNRAGAAALRVLRERWPSVRRIAISTGGGNNGGEGHMLAPLARPGGRDGAR